jgi:hypothetical protein
MKQSDLYDIVTKLVDDLDEPNRAKLLKTLAVRERPVKELIAKLRAAQLVKVGELNAWKVAMAFNAIKTYLIEYHHTFFVHPQVEERVTAMERSRIHEVGDLYDAWNRFLENLIQVAVSLRPLDRGDSVDS